LKFKTAFLLGIFTASVAIIAITYVSPPIDDFEVNNPFWNGLSELNSRYKPTIISDLSKLQTIVSEPQETLLLIIGPSKPFTELEAQSIRGFLNSGGLILLADDYGSGNNLLEKLGVKARFSRLILQDPLFREREKILPKILTFSKSKHTDGLNAIVLNYATTIIGLDGEMKVLAYSTKFSYAKSKVGPPDESSLIGPFPVVVEVPYGRGTLILVSDSSLPINGMLKMGDNNLLIKNISKGRKLLLDRSHWTDSSFTKFKTALTQIYTLASIAEVKYCIVALAVVLSLKVNLTMKNESVDDELKEVIKEHPDWDLGTLKKLTVWRERHGEE